MSPNPLVKLVIQGVVSLGLLAAGLYVLTTGDWKSNPELTAAATGWVGLVVGYWMK